MAQDVGRRGGALAQELGQQRDLVVLERARAAREGHGAAQSVGSGNAERQREHPADGMAQLLGRAVRGRDRGRVVEREPQVVGRVLGQAA